MSITTGNAPESKTKTQQTLLSALREPNAFPAKGLPSKSVAKRSKTRLIVGIAIGAVAGLVAIAAVFFLIRQLFGGIDQQLVLYTVTRGDLPINVSERGTIESQENVNIICEVDDLRDDGFRGTPISWIIRNGQKVKRGNLKECATSIGLMWAQLQIGQDSFCSALTGAALFPEEPKFPDLLVELESAGHIERVDRQILDRTAALRAQIEATAKYENQQTQNETLKENAVLEKDLAKLELEMFEQKTSRICFFYPLVGRIAIQIKKNERGAFNGTFELELDEIDRKIDESNTKILAAKANLALKKKEMRATESLFKLNYATKGELDRSKLAVLEAESGYASSLSSLETQRAARVKKTMFEKVKQSMTLKGNLATSKRKLKQVERDNESLLAQAKAKKDEADRLFKKEDERLKRYEEQVRKCKIHAPVDGMVAYAVKDARRWWMDEIKQGSPVNPRQHIMSIPNLAKMQVKTSVHESVIDQVRKGLPATVRMEAFPDKHFPGTVKSVAVLADQQSAETKVYETVVIIDGEVDDIKPGMTAIVEIHIDRIKDALSVPVQAIVQVGNESWCYVGAGRGVDKRIVKLGRTNHKFVEIRAGIKEGERVVLNPMVIVDQSDDEEQTTISPDGGSQNPTPAQAGDDPRAGGGSNPKSQSQPQSRNTRARTRRRN